MSDAAQLPAGEAAASVLIADNDRSVSDLLGAILVRAGIGCRRVYDGNAAREAGRQAGVRVVVCDLDMPGAPGLDVIASLGELATPPSVVVVSGYVDRGVAEQLARWPFVRAVLKKPFDLHEFTRIVRDLLAADGSGPQKG